MAAFGINVFDFGAKGDGVTDDTAAIQSAIDFTAAKGGGRILFPYTSRGYRLGSPAKEFAYGRPVRAQLIIPPGNANIMLEGEMPCKLLHSYQVRPIEAVKDDFDPTVFGAPIFDNTILFSDWDAPEETDPSARPWSILSAPEGNSCKGHFSVNQFSMSNLEFRVKLDRDKMYPTESCVNLQHVSRINVSDCQFCINEQVGDTMLEKELLHNPCHTAGLVTSGDQNDDNVLRNVACQGFRYGFVLGEHVVADYLYVHNCEEGITFHDCSHLSVLNHVVAQHNSIILSTQCGDLFGMQKGPCRVIVGSLNFECGTGLKPAVSQLKYGVYDPDGRLHGSLTWLKPWGKKEFPTVCGERFEIKKF